MQCPKCEASSTHIVLNEAWTEFGKVAGLSCLQCGYRSGLLFDERLQSTWGRESVDDAARSLHFSPEDWAIVQRLKDEPTCGSLSEMVGSILFAFLEGKLVFIEK